jgi:hypothetical protein
MPTRNLYLVTLLFVLISCGCSAVSSQQKETENINSPVQSSSPTSFKKAEKRNIKVSEKDLKNAKVRIAEVAFHSNYLWTLGQYGVLLRADLAKKKVEPFDYALFVADIYINEKNEFYLLTAEKADAPDWKILKKSGDDWLEVATLRIDQQKKEKSEPGREIIGLAEYQNRFLVLAENEVYWQKKDGEWQTVKLQNKGSLGLQTPFAVTDDGFIYVGLNHGEFGGGLWQISLKDGGIKSIEKKTAGKICFRPLDAACDPITSVVRDIENPNAVLAGIALSHFSQQGRVVKVSGENVSVVFNKIYKFDQKTDKVIPGNPCDGKNESDNLESWESEGVFGMQSDGKSVWLVTGRAIYKLAGGSVESCAELSGKFEDVDGLGISQAVAGIVLVGTDINWAKSLSGTTPLIAIKR